MSVLEFMREHLALTVIISTVLIIFIGLGSAVILAMSVQDPTPTPSPTPLPSPTINATITPIPTPLIPLNNSTVEKMSLDEFTRWVTDYYYNTTNTTTNQTFRNPMDQRNYQDWLDYMNQTHGAVSNDPGYVPGHPETANGSILFMATPIPCPTPTPIVTITPQMRERHKTVDNVVIELPPDRDGKIANIIAWDQEHTTGLYDYYSPGDHIVLVPRFINNYCPQEIKDPSITIRISKYILGQWVELQSYSWVEHVTLEAVKVDQYEGRLYNDLPAFTTVYEFDVPDKWSTQFGKIDTEGYYLIEVQVDLAWYNKACWFSKQVKIL